MHAGLSGDLAADLRAGAARAATAVDSGAGAELLARWAERSTELRAATT